MPRHDNINFRVENGIKERFFKATAKNGENPTDALDRFVNDYIMKGEKQDENRVKAGDND